MVIWTISTIWNHQDPGAPIVNSFFIAYQKGNALVITDVNTGTTKVIKFKDLPALADPAWSPDGGSIVFAGLVQGHNDLFQYDFKSKTKTTLPTACTVRFNPIGLPMVKNSVRHRSTQYRPGQKSMVSIQ